MIHTIKPKRKSHNNFGLIVCSSYIPEQEALEIDKALVNHSTGSRLVREKEHKLKKLEESLNDKVGPSYTSYFPMSVC